MKRLFILSLLAQTVICSCNSQSPRMDKTAKTSKPASTRSYVEGTDYQVYERVRLMDKIGFTQPQEAYSILLPKGWKQQSEIIWNQPGSNCAGTFKYLKASSPDNTYQLEMLPDMIFGWNTNPQVMQFQQQNNNPNSLCQTMQPVEAENYLRHVFVQQLGNPQVIEVEKNDAVVNQMRQMNETSMRELQQYGAGAMQFNQTAVNAKVKWNDGTEGLITLGVTILQTVVPNVYTGSSDMLYTTQVTKRTVFRYPAKQAEQARTQFAQIMASFHSNPAWNDAVNNFWRQARQQSNRVHIGRIQMIDERTRQIGQQAIKNGQQRLNSMDNEMRSWEQRQSSQDRMHTDFIKTIREVENYRDETGKYEMTSGYNHVWSREDGSSFILSNNPNFDPSSVLQDQRWKEMKKVD